MVKKEKMRKGEERRSEEHKKEGVRTGNKDKVMVWKGEKRKIKKKGEMGWIGNGGIVLDVSSSILLIIFLPFFFFLILCMCLSM